jgi:hypothetical protein
MMRSAQGLRSLLVVGSLSAVAAAGVSAGTAETSRRALERKVAQAIAVGYPGVPFTGVFCDVGKKVPRSRTFTCTASAGTTVLTVDARRTTKREIALEPREAVIARAALEGLVAEQATLAATVDCGGDTWRVLAVKATVNCRASLPDGTVKQVELTVEDRAGTVTVTKIA